MSAAVSSATKDATLSAQLEEQLKNKDKVVLENGNGVQIRETETEEEGSSSISNVDSEEDLDLSPQCSLHVKDKNDESLRKWKEQPIRSVNISSVGEGKEPLVKIQSLTIICPGRPNIFLPIPMSCNSDKSLFALKEGSKYRLRFTFTVSDNVVAGLKYNNVIWKSGVKVVTSKRTMGTFSPKEKPYIFETKEETLPSGYFVRGSYSARSKFVDDAGKCHLDVRYCFDLAKNWAT